MVRATWHIVIDVTAQAHPRGASFSRRRLRGVMHGPIPGITTATAFFGYAIAQLATEPINPGAPSFPLILAFFGASIGAGSAVIVALLRGTTADLTARARDYGFWGSFALGWVGILTYVGCLIAFG
jgi:hypothetical protein